jgi:hypothetical protein
MIPVSVTRKDKKSWYGAFFDHNLHALQTPHIASGTTRLKSRSVRIVLSTSSGAKYRRCEYADTWRTPSTPRMLRCYFEQRHEYYPWWTLGTAVLFAENLEYSSEQILRWTWLCQACHPWTYSLVDLILESVPWRTLSGPSMAFLSPLHQFMLIGS